MELPVDPTTADASAAAILRGVESRDLLTAALRATDVDADDSWDRDRLIAALTPIERGLLADQVRYAAPPTTHYVRLPGLERLAPSRLDDLADDSSYGTRLRAVDELFDRRYLVCSVPDGGAQAQLSVSEANRHTTVAAFDPGTDVLAVRAGGPERAAATAGLLAGVGPVGSPTRLDFRDPEFLTAFESDLLRGYHRLTFGQQSAHADRIEVASDEPTAETDLRQDEAVRSLLERPDTERRSGRGILDPGGSGPGPNSEPPSPTVDIEFGDGVIRYRTAAPESTRIAVDRAIRSL